MKTCFQIVERRKSIKSFYFQYQTDFVEQEDRGEKLLMVEAI